MHTSHKTTLDGLITISWPQDKKLPELNDEFQHLGLAFRLIEILGPYLTKVNGKKLFYNLKVELKD